MSLAERWPSLDLLLSVILALPVGVLLWLPQTAGTVFRVAVTLVYLLFVPGYVVVATLFPRFRRFDPSGGDATGRSSDEDDLGGRVDLPERVVLSFATSVAIVVLVGLALGAAGQFRTGTVYGGVTLLTVMAALAAHLRRLDVPDDQRLGSRVRTRLEDVYGQLSSTSSRAGVLINALLVVSILAAVLSTGVGALSDDPGAEGFTEFYLLPESESEELTADEYPDTLTRDETVSFVAVIDNHEGVTTEYTVVALLQRTDDEGGGTVEQSELYRQSVTLSSNETARLTHTISPDMRGDDLRIRYLLYRGPSPASSSAETAYREVHLWVDVGTEGGGT
jgi:uncharacterized membrane protein